MEDRVKANIERILDKEQKERLIPSVFLLALRDYDKGFLQLKRRVFFEMPKLKTRWGFFVLILMLTNYRTGILSISWKDLVAITGLARENVYKILRYLHNRGYVLYLPAKNKYRNKILLKVNDLKKYVVKPRCSEDSSLQKENCRDKKSLQFQSYSDEKSLQESISLKESKGFRNLNNNVLNKTTTEILERQRTLLECNEVYKEDIIQKIQSLFKEKTKIEIPKEVIYGKQNSLLDRFLVEKIIENIQRIHWGPRIDNPIGYLIKSLEDGYILPESEEERIKKEKEIREKEEEEFKKRMEELKKEKEATDYSLIRPIIEKCKMSLGLIKVKTI